MSWYLEYWFYNGNFVFGCETASRSSKSRKDSLSFSTCHLRWEPCSRLWCRLARGGRETQSNSNPEGSHVPLRSRNWAHKFLKCESLRQRQETREENIRRKKEEKHRMKRAEEKRTEEEEVREMEIRKITKIDRVPSMHQPLCYALQTHKPHSFSSKPVN